MTVEGQGGRGPTYSKDGRVIWHLRLALLWRLNNGQVLDIAATEDNVVVDLVIWRYLFVGVAASAFCAVRSDLF